MAVKVYLAGKISDPARAAWREHLFVRPMALALDRRGPDVRDENNYHGPYRTLLTWPTTPNTHLVGGHDYVGPYFIDCRDSTDGDERDPQVTGFEHGSIGPGGHGDWWAGAVGGPYPVFQECFAAMKRCDLVLAYLDGDDLYGTMIELGWAMAMAKVIVLVVPMPMPLGEAIGWPLTPYGDLLAHSGLDFIQVHPDHLREDLRDALEMGVAAVEATQLATMPYAAYLKTPHWQDVRQAALGRAAGRCQLCGASDRLDVHHNTYERRGHERASDVIALCRPCHSKHHGTAARR